jgi:hypothetical protein
MSEGQTKTLQELHDDIEAALFASQDIALESRYKALIAAKLEQALLWCKRDLGQLDS